MDVAGYKRAAVCAMTEFGLSDLRMPTTNQRKAIEDYFAAINANKSDKDSATKERYMAGLRVGLRCVKSMTRQQLAKVMLTLDVISAQEAHKYPNFER